jgi:hypothetical protein
MAFGARLVERALDQGWPTPRSRNAGSTVSGPSSSALVSPMRTGDSRTEPTSSVPMRAVNDTSRRCATCSRSR